MPEIRAENLVYDIQGRRVFDDVSFSWSAPRIGVLGRNGSGKSTLARLFAGLIAPSAGRIRIDDVDVYDDRKAALRKIGIVFQNPDQQIIFPTVIEEVKFGLAQQGVEDAEARALEVLQKYGVPDWKTRQITTLSQGQRHFIALISILEMRPDVLVLDEPFTGLDIPTVTRLQKLLAQFDGMVVHITHDPELIADYDHAVWLEAGAIEAEGAPKPMIAQYRKAMTAIGESHADTGF